MYQFAQYDGNLFKFGRLIKKEIRSSTQAFLAILRIRVVCANQNKKIWMVLANRAENIEPGPTRHLQVKNYSVRLYFLYAKDGFRNITCFSHKLRTGYLLKQVRQ